jgi:hypothetical protein
MAAGVGGIDFQPMSVRQDADARPVKAGPSSFPGAI